MSTNIFERYINNNEIILNETSWNNIVLTYSQEFIIKQLSDAIVLYQIKLPYREISKTDVITEYNELKALDTKALITNGKWITKFDYDPKYFFLDQYINNSNIGAKASDFFHQTERWKCDATGYPSPQKTWETEKYKLTLFKALFSLKVKEINPNIFRNIISLRKYIAAQFRPSAAKYIYDTFSGDGNVLDLSMGWGDRILAAHTSDKVNKYVGFDPNTKLFLNYIDQINFYNKIGVLKNDYYFHIACAEDETIILNDIFDLIFTSPPYYDKEKYDQSEKQSYIKYKKFDSWMKDFLFKSIELRLPNLNKDGYLIINVSDIYTRKIHYQICNGMNDFIASQGLKYYGAIGLRMPKRPESMSSKKNGVYAEPVFIWKKI